MRGLHVIKKALQTSLLAIPALVMIGAAPVSAAVANPAPSAKVSFTFDDSLASVYTYAAPTLAQYGLTGTSYVITNCVGMTTAPNNCAADGTKKYMTWDQVMAVQNTYGWEIGSHTVDHPQLATDGLTVAQVDAELANSKSALASHGINATDFATPYGDYNNTVLAEIAKYYESHRGFADVDNNVWPYNELVLNDIQIQEKITPVATIEAKIDAAIAAKNWAVLTFHDITTTPGTAADDYDYTPTELAQIAAYVKAKQDAGLVQVVSHHGGLVTSDQNLLTNGGFASGITGGWTTDDNTVFKADAGTNGSYPEATHSVSVTGGTTAKHLFSPQVAVDSKQNYMIKSYLNMTARTSGELGYYVDEYDAGGNWISGKWLAAKSAATVQRVSLQYTPSSTNVKKASLQVYVTANSGIKASIDEFQWFSLNPPAVTPPTTSNLLTNSTFDNGISSGWTTDNTSAFAADANNHGSTTDPAKSVKLTAGTTSAHLFAPKVDVKNTSTYNVNAFLNVATLTNGEAAFYIDEYDTNGAWVSGQYAYAQRSAGSSTVTFPYTPSSASVKKAGLQVILTGGSGITGYLDTVQFMAPAGETPPVTPTNLITNGAFDSGITSGWTTDDSTNIKADSANHGGPNNPVNSVSLTATTANKHLFSPKVAVDNTKSYSLAAYLNITARTSGVIGYYIDEYDASGNWISGQYKAGVSAISSGDTGFQYTPSSANVKQASLQVIVAGNSGIKAYFDDVRWYQN
jgi:peptidoglycan/xylan/chitin deacetylase (PgdA/CDA1 family)